MSRKKNNKKDKTTSLKSGIEKVNSFVKFLAELRGPCVVCKKRAPPYWQKSWNANVVIDKFIPRCHVAKQRDLKHVELYLHSGDCYTKFSNEFKQSQDSFIKSEVLKRNDLIKQRDDIVAKLELEVFQPPFTINLFNEYLEQENMTLKQCKDLADKYQDCTNSINSTNYKIADYGGSVSSSEGRLKSYEWANVQRSIEKGYIISIGIKIFPLEKQLIEIREKIDNYQFPVSIFVSINPDLLNKSGRPRDIEEILKQVNNDETQKVTPLLELPQEINDLKESAKKLRLSGLPIYNELKDKIDSEGIRLDKKFKEGYAKVNQEIENIKQAELKAVKKKAEEEAKKAEEEAKKAEEEAKKREKERKEQEKQLKKEKQNRRNQKDGMIKAGIPASIADLWIEDKIDKNLMFKMLQKLNQEFESMVPELIHLVDNKISFLSDKKSTDERFSEFYELLQKSDLRLMEYSREKKLSRKDVDFLVNLQSDNNLHILYLGIVENGFDFDIAKELILTYDFKTNVDAIQEVLEGANHEAVAAKYGLLQL